MILDKIVTFMTRIGADATSITPTACLLYCMTVWLVPAGQPYFFFRQSLINVLLSLPFSAFRDASALQMTIFCCCGVSYFLSEAEGAFFRQSLINALRSSPASVFAAACWLQLVIRCCCGVSDFSATCAVTRPDTPPVRLSVIQFS